MNKIILISLVIFFAICSKSWAEESNLNGKNLHCKSYADAIGKVVLGENYYFSFLNFKVIEKNIISNLYPFEIWKDAINYRTNNFYIYINQSLERERRINRKTLEFYVDIGGTYKTAGLCKIVSKDFINNTLEAKRKSLIKKYEEKNKQEREGNKI
jgi:hypothetical protein